MHSIQAQNLYECLTQARDAMLNMIITVGSLQKLEKGDGKRWNCWQNTIVRYSMVIYGQELGRPGTLQSDN